MTGTHDARRRISILGDSISTFTGSNPAGYAVFYDEGRAAAAGLRDAGDTWWGRVIDGLDGELLRNASYSGSMVQGAGFPAARDARRARDLCGENGTTPDVVIALIGINDYGWGSARAQAAGRSSATPACVDLSTVPPEQAGLAPVDAAETFGAAYAEMLTNVRAQCPGAEVWCCTLPPSRVHGSAWPTFAWNLRGVHLSAYNRQIRDAARACGCHVADLAAIGRDYDSMDGTHPTRLGMRQLADMTLAQMHKESVSDASFCISPTAPAGGGAEAPGGGGLVACEPAAWTSCDYCPTNVCVGCRWARGSANSWYTVCLCDRTGDE